MIWDTKNSKGKMLVDVNGRRIPMAFEFNDETCEVKCYMSSDGKVLMSGKSLAEGLEIIKVSFVAVGAKMISVKYEKEKAL